MNTLTKTDIAALDLAIARTLADPERTEQVTSMLADRDRVEVGSFCSYHLQTQNLRLKPWQFPPVWIDDVDEALAIPPTQDHHRKRDAAALLARMLELGISEFHPDPVAAIEAAKSRKVKA